MDKQEYNQKLELYMSSDAEPSVKEEAIRKLQEEYFGVHQKALKLINECAPDTSDIGRN